MGKRDPRVDAYIAKAAVFAKPILIENRDTVHASCPEVAEEMKWRFPNFTYKGMLCSIEWITEAKADETKARRVGQAIEWIAAGKSGNWKYQR